MEKGSKGWFCKYKVSHVTYTEDAGEAEGLGACPFDSLTRG